MKKLFLAFALIASCFAWITPISAADGGKSYESHYVRVVNYSDYEIVRIHAVVSSRSSWGDNLMSGVIRYNQYFDIETYYRNYYDFRIETRGGTTCTVKNVWMGTSKVFVFNNSGCYIRNW
jgi:hypothetical protein